MPEAVDYVKSSLILQAIDRYDPDDELVTRVFGNDYDFRQVDGAGMTLLHYCLSLFLKAVDDSASKKIMSILRHMLDHGADPLQEVQAHSVFSTGFDSCGGFDLPAPIMVHFAGKSSLSILREFLACFAATNKAPIDWYIPRTRFIHSCRYFSI